MYKETQKFDQWWITLLLYGLMGLFVYASIQQLLYNIPLGSKPAPNIVLILGDLLMLLLIVFFRYLTLTTVADKDGIRVQFKPFHRNEQVFKWQDIENAELITYKPLLHYGGWGIRYGLYGKAYSVTGDQGIMLTLKKGKKVLVGTQNPAEFQAYIEDIKAKK
jgi:hypothetical protein